MELNFEGLEMQKWNVPTEIVQIVDEKMSWVHSCASCDLLFAVVSRKNKKSHILHFNNYNSGRKRDFYQLLNILTPFFSSTLWALSVGLSHLCISRTSRFHFRGPPFSLCSGL